jgi:polar amino acid transport system substrate-binding protein
VDEALARIKPRRIDSGVDSSAWLSILCTRRADFLLIAPEEADYLLSRTELPRESFRYLPLTDMPPGNRRYVMFSRAVPTEIVDRFNAAHRAAPSLGRGGSTPRGGDW